MLCSVHVTREANGKVRGLCLLFAPVLRQLSFALPTSAASFGPQGALDLLQRTGQFQLQPNVVSYSGSAKTVPCCLLSCLMFSIFFHTASCGKKVQNSPSRELKSEAFADICRSWCLFHTVPVHTFSLHALLSTDIGTVSFVSASRCNSLCLRASKGLGASASGFAVENARWKSGASCAVPISMFASTSSTSSTSSTQFALSSLYSTVYPILSLFSRSLPVCTRGKLPVMWWLSMQHSVHWIVVRSGRRPSQNLCGVMGSELVLCSRCSGIDDVGRHEPGWALDNPSQVPCSLWLCSLVACFAPDETQAEPSKLWGRHQRMWRRIPVGGDLVQFWWINARCSMAQHGKRPVRAFETKESIELLSLLQKQLLEALEIYRMAVVIVLSTICPNQILVSGHFWRLQPNLIVMNLCLNASRKAMNVQECETYGMHLAESCRHLHLVLPCAETGEQSACVLEALQRYA